VIVVNVYQKADNGPILSDKHIIINEEKQFKRNRRLKTVKKIQVKIAEISQLNKNNDL